ncbi:MAG: class I SAM-dependent methyltransferase [Methylomonas sp.]|jgi:2-polyprenyl-3-methyl-5-hydroxy-6-metoxy-1,4-benzoquinol methylase|uniref:class I SAM-dependent methyltransferase n=1 Tax=Methylomonas sp. TaxID=418 RepID=UPI0025E54B1E|nr:class I SAM-dependent methyltransferase [Methylomonas sp.]MCK9605934.1 class I SAM-dependent methyltransferase [Methylomonas sp.]
MTYAPTLSGSYGQILHRCVSCAGENIRYWRHKNYQYTQGNTEQVFLIYRCKSCGTGFLNQPPHPQWLHTIYQYSGQALTQPISLADVLGREAEFPNCSIDAERVSQMADKLNLSGNQRALDVGSGFGFYTRALRVKGYDTVSINPGQYENRVFKAMNGEEPLQMMFEQYQTEQPFGVAVMSQVLEHLLEPDRAVKKVAGLLVNGGVYACAVPNFNSFLVKLLGTRDNACLWVPEHVNYFTEKGLRQLLSRHGLQIIKVEQVTRIPPNALSKRLKLSGRQAALMDGLVKRIQRPFTGLMNRLGLGIYINVYAVKTA